MSSRDLIIAAAKASPDSTPSEIAAATGFSQPWVWGVLNDHARGIGPDRTGYGPEVREAVAARPWEAPKDTARRLGVKVGRVYQVRHAMKHKQRMAAERVLSAENVAWVEAEAQAAGVAMDVMIDAIITDARLESKGDL